jgi:hypothetical protein
MVGQYGTFGGVEVVRAYWSPQLDEVAYDVTIPGVEDGATQRGVPASALRPYPGQELPLPPSYQQASPAAPVAISTGGGGGGAAPGSLLAAAAAANAARPTAVVLPSGANNGLPEAAPSSEAGVGSLMATMKSVMFELGASAAAGAAAAVAEASQSNQLAFVDAANAQVLALEEQKAVAIAAEQFEEAARLRDDIAALRRAQLTVNPGSGLGGLSAALLAGSAAAGGGAPEPAASPEQSAPEAAVAPAAPAAAKLRLRGADLTEADRSAFGALANTISQHLKTLNGKLLHVFLNS